MKAVCDAGPLIALAKLGQLGLLLKLHPDVSLPRQVCDEAVTEGLRVGAPDASAIHRGEVAVIVEALRQRADLVLIDDASARKAARQAGLRPRGTIGLLLDGLRLGHLSLPEFELLIESIRSQPSLWISERLCEEALRKARGLGP